MSRSALDARQVSETTTLAALRDFPSPGPCLEVPSLGKLTHLAWSAYLANEVERRHRRCWYTCSAKAGVP